MPVAISSQSPRAYEFLTTHQVGILATANTRGEPHAAAIYFLVEPDYTIYFITKQQTAKHDNLVDNPRVALAVFDAPSQTTVQLTGTASKVTDMDLAKQILQRVTAVSNKLSPGHKPPLSKMDAGKYVAYRLTPDDMKMAEFVKAEYPPSGELFETIDLPANSL